MPEKLDLAAYQALQGEVMGHSDWITVDQKMIDGFCEVTGDYQFIHNDPQRAKDDTPFGGAIAHGFLTLSLITQMYKDRVPQLIDHELVINYGLNRVRFLEPVPSGSDIRGEFKLKSISKRREGQYLSENEVRIHIKSSEKPAMIGTWLTLLVSGEL
jgi:acyl dehydratase